MKSRAQFSDHVVGQLRGNDFAPETVGFHLRPVLLQQHPRKVRLDLTVQIGIIRDIGEQQALVKIHLAVGEDHREFCPGEALAGLLSQPQFLVVRQELEGPVQQFLVFKQLDQACLLGDHLPAVTAFDAQGLGLDVVVVQDKGSHLGFHPRQQALPCPGSQCSRLDGGVEQDLDVDLMIGGIHTGGIVDGIGITESAILVVLDASLLGHPQVASFSHHPDAQFVGIGPEGIVRPVLGVLVGFRGCLHVRADTAVPQKVDFRLENGMDEFIGGIGIPFRGERLLCLGGQLDGLRGPRVDPPAR